MALISVMSLPMITMPSISPASSFITAMEFKNGILLPSLCTISISMVATPRSAISASLWPMVSSTSGGSMASSKEVLPSTSSGVYPKSLSMAGFTICTTMSLSVVQIMSPMAFSVPSKKLRVSSCCLMAPFISVMSLPIITIPICVPSSSFIMAMDMRKGTLRPSLCTSSVSLVAISPLWISARDSPMVASLSLGSMGSSRGDLPSTSSGVYPRSASMAGLTVFTTRSLSVVMTTSVMVFNVAERKLAASSCCCMAAFSSLMSLPMTTMPMGLPPSSFIVATEVEKGTR